MIRSVVMWYSTNLESERHLAAGWTQSDSSLLQLRNQYDWVNKRVLKTHGFKYCPSWHKSLCRSNQSAWPCYVSKVIVCIHAVQLYMNLPMPKKEVNLDFYHPDGSFCRPTQVDILCDWGHIMYHMVPLWMSNAMSKAEKKIGRS